MSMRHRFIATSLAGAMALAGIALAGPAAQAADDDTWGYDSTPKNADGSLDFSGWTPVADDSYGASLGSLDFTRNGIGYTIGVDVPEGSDAPLVANIITNNDLGQSWTYSFFNGDGSTSSRSMVTTDEDGVVSKVSLSPEESQLYIKSQDGALAVAETGSVYMTYDPDTFEDEYLDYSEVLDITSDGRLVHHLTLTNSTEATLSDIGFSVLLDTELNGDDRIPIISNGADSVYIDNGDFRLYLGLLDGDQMLAGSWGSSETLDGFLDVNGYDKDATILDGVDSSIFYGLDQADLPAGQSVSLTYEERLLAPTEIVPQDVLVKYADDDADGAAVTPKDGTTTEFSGLPGDPVGFTEDAAQAGVPDNYVYQSIDNVDTFDIDPATVQTITVHLTHQHTTGTVEATRTIHYTGAGELTPADAVQTLTWTTDTDDVTGQTTYEGEGLPAVATPAIDGYVTDTASVPAVAEAGADSTEPADSQVTVRYAESLPQNVQVAWVDDDADGAAVTALPDTTPVTLTGLPFETVGFTADMAANGAPEGYDVAGIDNVDTYDTVAAVDQTITVHLTHHHTAGTLTTTRTVKYAGAGSGLPGDVSQVLIWTTDTDEVTGVVTYASTNGYPALATPAISGRTADIAEVAATEATAPTTTKPGNTTVTVTYSAPITINTGGMAVTQSGQPVGLLALLFLGAALVVGGVGLKVIRH